MAKDEIFSISASKPSPVLADKLTTEAPPSTRAARRGENC